MAQQGGPAHGGAKESYSLASMIVRTGEVFDGFGRVFRPEFHRRVKVVELPKELATIDLEPTEVVLAVRVIIASERVERADTLENLGSHFLGHGRYTRGRHHLAADERLSEGIVEVARALGGHRRPEPWPPLGCARHALSGDFPTCRSSAIFRCSTAIL